MQVAVGAAAAAFGQLGAARFELIAVTCHLLSVLVTKADENNEIPLHYFISTTFHLS
ncbi:MAG: hypothetical protein ACI86X_002182 [Moritella sp.]